MPTRLIVPTLPTFTHSFIPLTFGSCISPYEYFQAFKATLCYVADVDDMTSPPQGRTFPLSSRPMPAMPLVASSASTTGSTSEGSTTQHVLEPSVDTIPMPDHPCAVVEYVD